MTGTWRDTLFVWHGKLDRIVESTATWSGTWVGVEGCPDARSAPTPTMEAFASSEMQFQVSGTIQQVFSEKYSSLFVKLQLADGQGWDLGEGSEKRRYKDTSHTLYMESIPNAHVSGSREMGIVVAVGVNEFGPFVSAGYSRIDPASPNSCDVMLGRRYLDERDQRRKWAVEDLYDRIWVSDHGSYSLGSYVMWADGKARRRVAPWRTLDLHAECLNGRSGKRKRTEEGRDRLEPLPSLYIPTDGFSPSLSIATIERCDNVSNSRLVSQVKWLEQCHGCGREIGDRTKACCKEVTEYMPPDQSHVAVGWAFYCSEDCAQRYGAQAWADASRTWARAMAGSGHFLKSNGASGFWYAIQNDKAAMLILLAAGWRKDFMDYILDSSLPKGEA
jgi:hypothetical protein